MEEEKWGKKNGERKMGEEKWVYLQYISRSY